ncbi:MAG: dTDP-glucose 4,6-dehydratase [Sphingomonadales bacterium]
MAKNILITGGAGFVGSNFVHYLMTQYPDYGIMILDALTYAGSIDNVPPAMFDNDFPHYTFWHGNVCNSEIVNALVAKADIVVHFAAETHVTRSIFDNRQFYETDVLGTHAVANAVLRHADSIDRFIHISTSEVYGTAERNVIDEDHPLNPRSPYASAKCGADRLVYSYMATYDFPAVIIRPFNLYGPRQHLEKVIPRFITSVLEHEPLTVHGNGHAARDFVFVEDLCRALDLVIHAPREQVAGEVFNVATGQHHSINDLARDIIAQMGAQELASVAHVVERPGQVNRHTGDASKIHNRLGWTPQIDWIAGLERTIAWYSAHHDWWQRQVWLRKVPLNYTSGVTEYH